MFILYKSRKKGNSFYNDIIAEYENGKEAYNRMLVEIEQELGYMPEIKVVSELSISANNDKYDYGVDNKYYGIAVDEEYNDLDCEEEEQEETNDSEWYPEKDDCWCHRQGIM